MRRRTELNLGCVLVAAIWVILLVRAVQGSAADITTAAMSTFLFAGVLIARYQETRPESAPELNKNLPSEP